MLFCLRYAMTVIKKTKDDDKVPDFTKVRAVEPIGSVVGCLLHIASILSKCLAEMTHILLTKISVMATVIARHKIVKLQLWCSWRKNKLAKLMNKICRIVGMTMALFFIIHSSVSSPSNEAKRILVFHILYVLPLLYLICQVRCCNSSKRNINNIFFRQSLNAF